MAVEKPPQVAADPFMSAKWDELTAGRGFAQADAPMLALLCDQYLTYERAASEVEEYFEGRTFYADADGMPRKVPQVDVKAQSASAIRQLTKMLGGPGGHAGREEAKVTPLEVIRSNYKGRLAAPDVPAGAGA